MTDKTDDYQSFLDRKAKLDPATGIDNPSDLPSCLFDFQDAIVRWALRRGRSALFAGTGLGKSLMELSWAGAVENHTNKPVLIFTPLAVAAQMVREANKFGLPCVQVSAQSDITSPGVYVTNYQKIDHFDLTEFGGIVLDESSILKSVDGHYRTKIIQDSAQVPFRLAATATPAPNDFMELGNHAEFLGVMSYTDMLATFFTHDGGETQKWRLKRWAETRFWEWMSSWSVMLRHPKDLGFKAEGYDLPPLHQTQHTVAVDYAPSMETGTLFPMEARTLGERLSARRETIEERVLLAAELTPKDRPFVWWCNLNSEADALCRAIHGAVEVRGSDSESEKERKLSAFSNGEIRVLVTKPIVAGFGMNWQHCADTGFVGLNDSFEQIYQAIRRFWRFGQTNPVNVHFIASEMDGAVVSNIRRKEADADRMAKAMIEHMADLSATNIRSMVRDTIEYVPEQEFKLPGFMRVS